MKNALVKLFGWRGTTLLGDPTVVDRARWLQRHLQPGPLRTLDAGCGAGAFTLYAGKIGNTALGLSFSQAQIDKALSRAKILGIESVAFREMDLRTLDEHAASLGRFDQVIVFETIEHILNDQKLVDDLADLLKPGGTILLTTPSMLHRRLWGERLSGVEDGGHVRWGYTHQGLRVMFERAGLEVVAEEFISGVVSQKLASLQYGLSRISWGMAWGLTLPLRVFHPLDGILTGLTNYPPLSVGVVGRKPMGSA
jgi:2-polyprenyl-3-methyl-5-hydroxy-6-metoxy-1,4-benzoquinol methylase